MHVLWAIFILWTILALALVLIIFTLTWEWGSGRGSSTSISRPTSGEIERVCRKLEEHVEA